MNRKYWEKIAPGYNEEIFDVLKNDKKALISRAIRKIASPNKTVIDAGCAIGKWLPVLSPLFKKVYAIDISAKNLAIAEKTYPALKNITYRRADLSGKMTAVKADVVVCINAILTDSVKKQTRFLKNIASCLRKNGDLILVVPSLESWLLTRTIQSRWKIDRQLFRDKLSGMEGIKRYKNIQQGNVEIDNVATKHYLCEELMLLLFHEGLAAKQVKKIEYNWNTEFINPPKWLREPRPWDWLIVCKKN